MGKEGPNTVYLFYSSYNSQMFRIINSQVNIHINFEKLDVVSLGSRLQALVFRFYFILASLFVFMASMNEVYS